MRTTPSCFLTLATLLTASHVAHANGLFHGQDVDPEFRARIMKEKVKINQHKAANNFDFTKDNDAPRDGQCGSQNIGNIDTGGKPGTAPREVFVFAPNAININSVQGCK